MAKRITGQQTIDEFKKRIPKPTEPKPEKTVLSTRGNPVKRISEADEIQHEPVKVKATPTKKVTEDVLKNTMLVGQMRLDDFNKLEQDTIESFRRIEENLIDDIMKNLRQKPATSVTHFQIEQLKRLEQFRERNLKKYSPTFAQLNDKIAEMATYKYYEGLSSEEKRILMAIQNGYSPVKVNDVQAKRVYELHKKKLEALIKATTNDMVKAEHAVLRRASDIYKSIIYDAQLSLNTGSMSYTKAIDMATKDFLASGIQSITYSNGSVHKISDYCDMAIKTANKRAYLIGEGQKRQEMGCHLVIVGKRGKGLPCECCAPYIGKVLVDDVYSGGTKAEAKERNLPLLSEAMEKGHLFHPRCKDTITTYFPQLTKLPKKITAEETREIAEKSKEKQKQSYERRQAEKYERMSKYSLAKENKQKYNARAKEWRNTN